MISRLLRSSKPLAWRSPAPNIKIVPRRLPRSQLRPTPLLRRSIIHQRRSIATDHSSSSSESRSYPIVALPLSHRPLLPGMTIHLYIHESMYNKIIANGRTMLGAFLVNRIRWNDDYDDDNNHDVVVVNGRPRRRRRLVGPIAIDRALVAAQFIDLPHIDDIYKVGTLCKIVEITPDHGLLIESLRPIVARSFINKSLLTLDVDERVDEPIADENATLAVGLQSELIEEAVRLSLEEHVYAEHLRVVAERALASPMRPTELSMVANQIGGLSTRLTPDDEQTLVEERDPIKRARRLLDLIKAEPV